VTSSIKSFLLFLEIDRAVIFGALGSLRAFVFGPLTAIIIVFSFTPEIQGYYYTFSSLLALQVFMEMGLGRVIMHTASHEWAGLSFERRRKIIGQTENLSRLVSLGRAALKWYIIAGIFLPVLLVIVGYFFFNNDNHPGFEWLKPWLLISVLTGIKLFFVPVWSLLEGCGQIAEVTAYRLIEGILTNTSLCLAIMLGAKLWVFSITTILSIVFGLGFLKRYYWGFFQPFFVKSNGPSINWIQDVWPMQWRIAISGMSNYFSFYLFVPILFHYHGPVAAGKMGMTLAIIAVLSEVSSRWIYSKAPRFGVLIASKKYCTLDKLFIRTTIVPLVVMFLMMSSVEIIAYLMYRSNYPLSQRILSPVPLGLFLFSELLMVITYSQLTYLRAHKKEPFMVLFVLQGVLTGLSTWLLGSHYGAIGMAVGYSVIMVFFVVPYGTFIWRRFRVEWHNQYAN
jgi:hypothetical protein